jgi:hypothetical protein
VSGRLSKLLRVGLGGVASGERTIRGAPSLCESGATAPHIKGQTEVQSWPFLLSGQWPGQSASRCVPLTALGVAQPASADANAAVKEDSTNKAMRMSVNRRSISGIRSVADQRLHRK